MGLFDDQLPPAETGDPASEAPADAATPLPERLRPRTLDEVAGHEQLLGADGFLRRAIAADRVPSLIFWGPPGTGKTTLARLIAAETEARFVPFSAVTSGIKEVKAVMAEAERYRRAQGRRTLVFIDEIHRFNRAQQDAFLPYVERGDIVLVGATTENPSFEVNAALLSRCRVLPLSALSDEALRGLLERALTDDERGLGGLDLEVEDDGLTAVIRLAGGDARRALSLLEAVALDAAAGDGRLSADSVARVGERKVLLYDKSGEEHFNLISALHKSLRDSDADGAIYWLARMLAAGEDPLYIARRMLRFASEDVGLADPYAVQRALSAWDAYHRLGSPEGELALAQLAVDLALAPKSVGVYRGWKKARKVVEERPADPVPASIRNAPTRLMKDLGYGEGYVYAPDTEEGVAGLQCLPDALAGETFYEPSANGREVKLRERLERFRAVRRKDSG